MIILAFNYLLSTVFENNLVIKDIKYISELTNQFDKNPILTLSFIICLLSMAGIPPFIGFYSKLFVLFSAISMTQYFISIVAILVSVISAYYYLRIIKVLYTEDTFIANITYKQINPISPISNNNLNNHNTNCTELAFDLGQSLLYSYYSFNYQQYKKDKAMKNDFGLSQFINDNYLSFNNSVTDIILIQIGLKLLYFLEASPGAPSPCTSPPSSCAHPQAGPGRRSPTTKSKPFRSHLPCTTPRPWPNRPAGRPPTQQPTTSVPHDRPMHGVKSLGNLGEGGLTLSRS